MTRDGESGRTIEVLEASAIDKWPTLTLTADQEVLTVEATSYVDSAYNGTRRHVLRAVVLSGGSGT